MSNEKKLLIEMSQLGTRKSFQNEENSLAK